MLNDRIKFMDGRKPDPGSTPALSAIVVIPDMYDTVRCTMGHLQAQTVAKQIEIILVVPSCQQIDLDESDLECFHSWSLVYIEELTSIACGFVAGIRQAHAPIIALTEDHSFPDRKWAELFLIAHLGPYAVVGPRMRNGNPTTMISWADFYQAYGEWSHHHLSGIVRHLPGHNSSYKKDILLRYGNELELLMQAESVLHRRLVAEGYQLFWETETCTTHFNFDSWTSWIPTRYYAGRQFAANWARTWAWPRRLLFTIASPLIPCVRLYRVIKQIRREQSCFFILRLLHILIVGLVVEGIGHMVAYALGGGNAEEKLSYYEFHRDRFIKSAGKDASNHPS